MGLDWLISVVIILAVLGLIIYLANLLPMPAAFKQAILAVSIVVVVIWLLRSVVMPLLH